MISQAKNLYINGEKRFPECVGLKIDYSWFLLSKMHNKRDALKELISAEKYSTSLDDSFKVYHYKQIIEEELYDMEGGGSGYSSGGLDYVAAINYENHFRQFRNLIERSATLHFDFWNLLMEDQPDLMRLKDQGSKINLSI